MEGNPLEIIGTLVGLIYLWLEYRASIYLWIAGIVMPAIYIVVYYRAGLYADFGINIYYLVAAIYGWLFWMWGGSKKAAPPITHTPPRCYLPLTIVFVAALLAIAFILIRYTDSTVPWLDSFTTALSIVGMWMLARKYMEQWFAWIAVDAVCCGLYIYKELYFTSILYGIYAIIAIFGYLQWRKLMNAQWSTNTIPLKP
ncbi:MAG: nicotinamide riboside transporter PnuC [Mediterranea sp.]|jgi:nicotinamide mononucleotide transporter|nr:nicotinamide riboside transporter PnuC [Mediterranea sp.]